MGTTHRIGMFAKYWQPGKVKTRLAKSIGDENAADIYRAFIELLMWRLPAFDNAVIVFSPDDCEQAFRDLIPEERQRRSKWSFQPQGDGDLGCRIQRYFERAFGAGFRKVSLIGTDSPTIPETWFYQADRLLDYHQVVLGPTEDGGYYLVAARDRVPPIFSDIEWSTDRVWFQTLERLQRHGMRFAVLPTWYDVDEIEDLERLKKEVDSIHQAGAEAGSSDSPQSQLQLLLRSVLDRE